MVAVTHPPRASGVRIPPLTPFLKGYIKVFMLKNLFKRQEPKVEKQELYCHDCGNYVQFDIDMSLNGNHVLNCPECGHEHCRVVKNGIITSERWDSRNGLQYYIVPTYTMTTSSTSTFDSYSGTSGTSDGSTFLYESWMNTTTGT